MGAGSRAYRGAALLPPPPPCHPPLPPPPHHPQPSSPNPKSRLTVPRCHTFDAGIPCSSPARPGSNHCLAHDPAPGLETSVPLQRCFPTSVASAPEPCSNAAEPIALSVQRAEIENPPAPVENPRASAPPSAIDHPSPSSDAGASRLPGVGHGVGWRERGVRALRLLTRAALVQGNGAGCGDGSRFQRLARAATPSSLLPPPAPGRRGRAQQGADAAKRATSPGRWGVGTRKRDEDWGLGTEWVGNRVKVVEQGAATVGRDSGGAATPPSSLLPRPRPVRGRLRRLRA